VLFRTSREKPFRHKHFYASSGQVLSRKCGVSGQKPRVHITLAGMDTHRAPSLLAWLLATGWLVARRLVCFAAALFFTVVLVSDFHNFAWMDIVFGPHRKQFVGWERVEFVAGLAVFIAFLIFYGVVGGTWAKGATLREIMATYRDRKLRYGWRW
jgi:hypothetical protein